MAEISQITLPNGATYSFKDTVAREASKVGIQVVVPEGGQLPEATAETSGKLYLTPQDSGTNNSFNEWITIQNGSGYKWEQIGTTAVDLSGYSMKTHTHTVTSKVSVASHSYTPAGTISTPTFKGTSGNVSVSGTPTGSVTVSEATSGATNFTPRGSVSAPTITSVVKNTSGTAITPYTMSSAGSYTPSQWAAGSYTKSKYTPETYAVSNETLLITPSSYTAESVTMPTYTKESVTLPGRTQMVISATSTAPTFTGVATRLEGAFSGNALTSTGSFTPAGTVSQPTFTGTAATLTHSVTNGAATTGQAN